MYLILKPRPVGPKGGAGSRMEGAIFKLDNIMVAQIIYLAYICQSPTILGKKLILKPKFVMPISDPASLMLECKVIRRP